MNLPLPPAPPIVVIDTNIVLDWLVFADPSVAALSGAVRSGAVRWVACERALMELQHVLTRPQILAWQPDLAMIEAQLGQHAERTTTVPPSAKHLLRCTDPDDQKFLDLALNVRASWLVSKDKALLRLARRAAPLGLRIATPQAWTASRTRPEPTAS
jgi:putative PIN family toxin of toxin-antitoxin system